MNDFLNLLEIAKSDIKSSRILFERKLYSQSYFYFQQASEKANKALWLLLGLYNKHELQKLGHNQFKPLRKSAIEMKTQIELLNSIDKNLSIITEHPLFSEFDFKDYSKEVKSSISFIDGLHQYDLVNIEANELQEMLDSLEEVGNIDFEVPPDFDEKFKKILYDQADWFEKFSIENDDRASILREILGSKGKYQECKIASIKFWNLTMELMYCQICLFYCSFLTIQHSSATRYPDFKEETTPLNIYTENLPIVIKQKAFLDHLDKAVGKLIMLCEKFEFKENEIEKSVSKEKYKINSPSPDKSWEIFGAKNKRDFIERFLVEKKCHSEVPEQIQKELEYAEQLQSHSYYFYPMYSDAFSRLTRVFEMAIRARAKELEVDTDKKSLNKLIDLISTGYPQNFVSQLHWGRKMRNYNSHPEMTTMYGSVLKLPLINMTNTINDIFRDKTFFELNIQKLEKLKLDYKQFQKGLWVLGDYLVHSIKPISVRGSVVLWMFIPVQANYPQTKDKMYSPMPFFAYLKSQRENGNNFIGLNWEDVPVNLYYTEEKKNLATYQNFVSQIQSSPVEVKEMVNMVFNNNVNMKIQEFRHQTNNFKI